MHISLDEAQLDAFAANGLLIIDNFLEEKLAHRLLEDAKHWQAQEAFKQAGIGRLEKHVIQENYRRDKIKWINRQECLPATSEYIQILDLLLAQVSKEFFLSLKDYECMFAIYPKGAFYKKHTDQFARQPHRIISVVMYLNENWEPAHGGELIVYKDDEEKRIEPIFNRLAFFKSELWHEVLPCTKERFSLTGWMKDQLNDIFI